jgi:hypothetical protein
MATLTECRSSLCWRVTWWRLLYEVSRAVRFTAGRFVVKLIGFVTDGHVNATARGEKMARKPAPVPDPMHRSLKPDGSKNNKGSYYRRLEDIKKGLKKIDKSRMPTGGKFLFLYYGCEKLGKGIVGIAKEWIADDAYDPDRKLHLHELKPAAAKLKLSIPDPTLDFLFTGNDKTSPRFWRNEIVHNIGPSNVDNVVYHSLTMNKKMHDFLDAYTQPVLAYLRKNYSHIP